MIWIILRLIIGVSISFAIFKALKFLLKYFTNLLVKTKISYVKQELKEDLSKFIKSNGYILSILISLLTVFLIVIPELNLTYFKIFLSYLCFLVDRFIIFVLKPSATFIEQLIEDKDLPKEDKSLYLTLLPIARDVLAYFSHCISGLIVLGLWGVNLKPFFGATAIAGAVIGLAGRNAIEDMFAFGKLLAERPYYVGSEVEFIHSSGYVFERGVVKEITPTKTIIKVGGHLTHIPNSDIKMFRVYKK